MTASRVTQPPQVFPLISPPVTASNTANTSIWAAISASSGLQLCCIIQPPCVPQQQGQDLCLFTLLAAEVNKQAGLQHTPHSLQQPQKKADLFTAGFTPQPQSMDWTIVLASLSLTFMKEEHASNMCLNCMCSYLRNILRETKSSCQTLQSPSTKQQKTRLEMGHSF